MINRVNTTSIWTAFSDYVNYNEVYEFECVVSSANIKYMIDSIGYPDGRMIRSEVLSYLYHRIKDGDPDIAKHICIDVQWDHVSSFKVEPLNIFTYLLIHKTYKYLVSGYRIYDNFGFLSVMPNINVMPPPDVDIYDSVESSSNITYRIRRIFKRSIIDTLNLTDYREDKFSLEVSDGVFGK